MTTNLIYIDKKGSKNVFINQENKRKNLVLSPINVLY
jgi:hypothetical protein